MGKTKVPCALVTSMDRHTTDELLARLGLRNYFTCLVTGARRLVAAAWSQLLPRRLLPAQRLLRTAWWPAV